MNKVLIPGLLVLYGFFAASGLFLGPEPSFPYQLAWLTGYLLIVLTVAYRSLFSDAPFRAFPFIVLGVLLLNFLVQLTGGVHSFLLPAYFVFVSVAGVFLPLLQTLATSAIILVIEGANLYLSGGPEPGQYPIYAGFTLSLAVVPAIISHIIHRTRREAAQAKDEHEKLLERADAIDPLDDTDTIGALTDESQLASNVKASRSLEASFDGLLDMIYGFVPAHAYALFVKERAGDEDSFVLRARRSDAAGIFLAPLGEVLNPGKAGSLLMQCVQLQQPQYLPSVHESLGTLGYYVRAVPVRSLLAIPITRDRETIGILAIDSLEEGAFSLETQDMLARFSPFFIEIIEKIRVTQELGMRARTFAAMHTMSAVLNSTLELEDILDGLAREINILVPNDFCVFVLYDDRNRAVSVVHQSGLVELADPEQSLLRKVASSLMPGERGGANDGEPGKHPLEQGTLINQMLNQWEKGQSAPYHWSDLGERTVVGLIDTSTRLTRQLRSLSCWPLAKGEKFIGAFFLGSLRPHAFSEFHLNFLETLSSQIALVMDNAILHQQISSLARTDGLTGLLNHRTFVEKLAEEYRRIDREPRPFSILLMDIDKFKAVNDTYGHPVGDIAIKAVATVLRETARTTDFVARYGGEEFAVGMVDTTTKGARQMAERVRSIMEKTVVTAVGSRDLKITLSIGVASFPEDTKTPAELVTLSDNALYQAKKSGRNRVCLQKDIEAGDGQPQKHS